MNTEAGMERLGRSIRLMRELTGLTQDQIAERGGPSDVTIRGLENGAGKKPNAATLRKLDKGLGWPEGFAAKIITGDAELFREYDADTDEVFPTFMDYSLAPEEPPFDPVKADAEFQSLQGPPPLFEQATPELLTELTGRFRAQEVRIASLERERDELKKRLARLQGVVTAAGGSGVAGDAERDGVTPDEPVRPWEKADFDLAADTGVSKRAAMDEAARRRGEESQAPEDWA